MANIEIGRFAHQVTVKAVILALALGLLTLVTRRSALVLGLLAGATVDIGTFYLLSTLASTFFKKAQRRFSVLAMIGLFILRISLQALVLYLALVYSNILNFWTTLMGILLIQVMIFTQAALIQFQGQEHGLGDGIDA